LYFFLSPEQIKEPQNNKQKANLSQQLYNLSEPELRGKWPIAYKAGKPQTQNTQTNKKTWRLGNTEIVDKSVKQTNSQNIHLYFTLWNNLNKNTAILESFSRLKILFPSKNQG